MVFRKREDEAEDDAPAEEYVGQRWEYTTLNLNTKASIGFDGAFNKLGRQGWEFVAVASRDNINRAIFKRPVH